jgi:hypothetical protein
LLNSLSLSLSLIGPSCALGAKGGLWALGISLVIRVSRERETMMEETKLWNWGVIRSLLAILQWWGFNVTVIIMNKWIFQVPSLPSILLLSPFPFLSIGFYLFMFML